MSNTSKSLSSAIENAKKDLAFVQMVKNLENSEFPKIQEDIFELLKGKDYLTAKETLQDALEILEVKAKII